MNFFNNKGEINASSMRETLMQLAKYASILEENQPSNVALAGQVSDEERDSLIARAMLTQDGKLALAQAMANPIN